MMKQQASEKIQDYQLNDCSAMIESKELSNYDKVQQMRDEYESIIQLNMSLPPQIRIPLDDLQTVDGSLDVVFESMYQDRLAAINLEFGDQVEQIRNKRQILEDTHRNNIDYGHTIVMGLKSGLTVGSFQTLKLPTSFLELRMRLLGDGNTADYDTSCSKNENKFEYCGNKKEVDILTKASPKDIQESNNLTAERKSCDDDSRKMMRAKRRDEIREKMNNEPLDQDEPEDIKTFDNLQENFGDWKIKSSSSYKVPIHKQVDTRLKLIEMVLCEESMQNIKFAFNKELKALQNKRNCLANIVREKNNKIIDISKRIGEPIDPGSLWSPTILDVDGCEFTPSNKNVEPQTVQGSDKEKKYHTIYDILPQLKPKKEFCHNSSDNLSHLEQDKKIEREARLRHEKSVMLKGIEKEVTKFDESLYRLIKRHVRLGVEIKCGELRLMTMLEELKLLSNLENEGNRVISRQTSHRVKAIEIQNSISSQKMRIEEKKAHLQSWLEKDKNLEKEFKAIVPETHINHDILCKLYMRKVQRFDEANYLSSDDDDEDDDSSWESDGDEDYVCPQGCHEETYQLVLKLREKRHEQEDKLKLFQRDIGIMKRNHDKLCGRENQASRELKEVDVLLQAYQEKKQRRLNNIPSFLTLSTKQVHLWNTNDYSRNSVYEPEDVDTIDCVIFCKQSLHNLYGRIHVLHEEIEADKEKLKSLHSNKKHLGLETKILEQSIAELQQRCTELQMLKFGQVVDMEKIDMIPETREHPNVSGAEMAYMFEAENGHQRLVLGLEKELASFKTKLKDATTTNTRIFNEIACLNERQIEFSHSKDELETKKFADEGNREESTRLGEKSKEQQEEIKKIEAEIRRLKSKNGHIHTFAPRNETGGAH